jgi:hypothetical protein
MVSATNDHLDGKINSISEEIGILCMLSNTIRKASKENQNLKAATSFIIRDEEGNDYGSNFRDLFAFEIINWKFPKCEETLKHRLADAMLLRRKRVLYRRSRYGKFPSMNDVSSVPKNEDPNARAEQFGSQNTLQNGMESLDRLNREKQEDTRSHAITATTLNLEQWNRASTPSVVSRSNTVRLSDSEKLEFPPSPKGPILQKLKERKEQRLSQHKKQLESLPNYKLYVEHNGDPPLEPNVRISLESQIEYLADELEDQMEADRKAIYKGNIGIICPYCCCVLSSEIVMNDIKWM